MNATTSTRRALALAAASLAGAAVLAPAASAAPPVNTAPPTITGTARQGQTLTAQNGSWENGPTAFQYRWQRCGSTGNGCVGIQSATQRTYSITADDVGGTLRVRVTAVNADGATNARSEPTAVVASSGASPRNTGRPTISGSARVGAELTAGTGSWSGTPSSFGYQWQRCDADGTGCTPVGGATGRTYGVRQADLGFRLRVAVSARNGSGTTTSTSGVSPIVEPAVVIRNRRPTLRILSVRFLGARVYARFRVCDDSRKNVTILQTDSRPNRASYSRRFSSLVPPRPCRVYTRNWLPAPRFRGDGRYTVTLRARDKSAFTSLPARRTFVR